MKLKILLFILSLTLFLGIQAQQDSLIKAIYIDNFFKADSSQIILGDSAAEQQLFNYAQNCGFNYLILYGLSAVPLGNNPDAVDALRNFIRTAHEQYGLKLGCIGQSSNFFNRIHTKYQSLEIVESIERLDSYNLEFEFWHSYHSVVYEGYYCENYLSPNGYSCDSIGAFEFAMDEVTKIDSLARLLNDTSMFTNPSLVEKEIYVGWINEYHAEILAEKIEKEEINRILGAVYKPALDDGSLNLYNFFHQTERLKFLGSQENTINFLPIFAVKENQGNHLNEWMDTIGSIPYVWEHYLNEFDGDTSSYVDSVNLHGYVWYNYSHMPLCFDSLEDNGLLYGPEGELIADSIYSFQLEQTANADRFYWELPMGVSFTDSLKWNAEANLIFSSSFKQGDSIKVRAANRCHIGESQYYSAHIFDDVFEQIKIINTVYYSNGEILIYLVNDEYKPIDYQIFNLNGKLLKSGVMRGRSIPFERKSGFHILKLYLNSKPESFIF